MDNNQLAAKFKSIITKREAYKVTQDVEDARLIRFDELQKDFSLFLREHFCAYLETAREPLEQAGVELVAHSQNSYQLKIMGSTYEFNFSGHAKNKIIDEHFACQSGFVTFTNVTDRKSTYIHQYLELPIDLDKDDQYVKRMIEGYFTPRRFEGFLIKALEWV
jgi:hypothetical protein